MNVNTNFNQAERAYAAEVEQAAARYVAQRKAIREAPITQQAILDAALALAKTDYESEVNALRTKYNVDKDGRSLRTTSESKSYAPAHGGYPGTVVVR